MNTNTNDTNYNTFNYGVRYLRATLFAFVIDRDLAARLYEDNEGQVADYFVKWRRDVIDVSYPEVCKQIERKERELYDEENPGVNVETDNMEVDEKEASGNSTSNVEQPTTPAVPEKSFEETRYEDYTKPRKNVVVAGDTDDDDDDEDESEEVKEPTADTSKKEKTRKRKADDITPGRKEERNAPNKRIKVDHSKQDEEVLEHLNWNRVNAELVHEKTFNVVYPRDVDERTADNYTTGSHFLALWNMIQEYKAYEQRHQEYDNIKNTLQGEEEHEKFFATYQMKKVEERTRKDCREIVLLFENYPGLFTTHCDVPFFNQQWKVIKRALWTNADKAEQYRSLDDHSQVIYKLYCDELIKLKARDGKVNNT